MFTEFLKPLECQFDSGFGATANTFHEAAKALDIEEHQSGFGLNRSRLPVLYLYRHANELYLKSIITILHRRLAAHYPNIDTSDFPVIDNNKKIFNVHSIGDLYQEFRNILTKNATSIKTIGKTDWVNVPKGLDELVKLIDDADEKSVMFRYPFTLNTANDIKKSSFKNIHPNKAIDEMQNESGKFIIAMTNDDGEIVNTFIHDKDAMHDVFEALKELSDILLGVQLGILAEFVYPQIRA
ncbi:MAG: hypothetical protein CTY16_13260 [Methylobacter sp.]|nr:MAG: hypothetical protein CTY16_13260 [Methylobacter sp.]